MARVVEEADATEEEQAIAEVNTSIYCFRRSILAPALRRLSPANAQGEYYLTDAVGVLFERRATGCSRWSCPTPMEAAGVNDRAQLAVAEAELRDRINERWMRRGVTMWDPERTYVDAEVTLAPDVSLLPGRDPARQLRRRRGGGDRSELHPDRHRVGRAAPMVSESSCTGALIGARAPDGPLLRADPGAEVADGAGGARRSACCPRQRDSIAPGAAGWGGRGTARGSSVGGVELIPRRRLELISGRAHPALAAGHRRAPRRRAGRGEPPRVRQRRDPLPATTSPSGAVTSSSSRPTAAR